VNNNVLDLSALSDRALIALQAGLDTLWAIQRVEARNAYFPEGSDTTVGDLDLVDAISEELYERGNGGHRFCNEHLLPLVAPDYCDNCPGAHINNNESEV